MPSPLPKPTARRRRTGQARDRRGRGRRGPMALPGPLSTEARLLATSRAARFDDLVLSGVERIETRWRDDLAAVEFGVEDCPPVDVSGGEPAVPLAALLVGSGGEPTRVVVFRRPIEARAASLDDLQALVFDVLVEQVADLLGRSSEEIDPT